MKPTKHCRTCDETKPTSEFNKNAGKADGLQTQCRGCKKSAQARWYARNRDSHIKNSNVWRNRRRLETAERVFKYLSAHPCVDCGERDPVVLEFDHIRDKTDSVSTMVSNCLSWKRISAEIAKCEVRCANCHRRKTAKDFGWLRWRLQATHVQSDL